MLSLISLAAAAATPLMPTGTWNVDEAPDRCILSRLFGGESPVNIGFQPMTGSESFILLVTTKNMAGGSRQGSAKITLHPSGDTFDTTYVRGSPDTKTSITRLILPRTALAAMPTAHELEIEASPMNLTVAIGSPAKALTALQTCEDELLKTWGIDPATANSTRAAIRAQPSGGDVQRLFGDPSNYPQEALKGREQGLVVTVITVSALGVAENCRVVAGASEALNEATCRLFRRIKFEAAKDATGKSIGSNIVMRFRWSLPPN